MAQMNTAQILLVDLFPTQGSTITACVSASTHIPSPSPLLSLESTLHIPDAPSDSNTLITQNNLVRSSLGAAFVSVIDLILTALHGPGWTFVLIAGICLVVGGPVLAIEMKWGPVWRERRRRNAIAAVTDAAKREVEQAA